MTLHKFVRMVPNLFLFLCNIYVKKQSEGYYLNWFWIHIWIVIDILGRKKKLFLKQIVFINHRALKGFSLKMVLKLKSLW